MNLVKMFNTGKFGKDPILASRRFSAGMLFMKDLVLDEMSKPDMMIDANMRLKKVMQIWSEDDAKFVASFFYEEKTKNICAKLGLEFNSKSIRYIWGRLKKCLDQIVEVYIHEND